MKAALLLFALALAFPVAGQEPARKKEKKKPAAPAATAHKKPTPEQIRKFNELEKKQKKQ